MCSFTIGLSIFATGPQNSFSFLGKLQPADKNQLAELERRLDQAEQEVNNPDLEKQIESFKEARIWQGGWVRDYEEELAALRREALNIRAIKEALPNGCFNRLQLEP